MPSELAVKGLAPRHQGRPQKESTLLRRTQPKIVAATSGWGDEPAEQQVDDWGSGGDAPVPPETWDALPYNRTALPGSQSEHFEHLFHLEKVGLQQALHVSTTLPRAGWDEGLEELSIVTLCPNEESWDRLRSWIEQYSTTESRRPWLAPKDFTEPPSHGLTLLSRSSLKSSQPSLTTPTPSTQTPFNFNSMLAVGAFPDLDRDEQLASVGPKAENDDDAITPRVTACRAAEITETEAHDSVPAAAAAQPRPRRQKNLLQSVGNRNKKHSHHNSNTLPSVTLPPTLNRKDSTMAITSGTSSSAKSKPSLAISLLRCLPSARAFSVAMLLGLICFGTVWIRSH